MSNSNPKVDFYFEKAQKWQKEISLLRKMALACDLSEELKWGNPCYLSGKANIVLIHTFKEYCALLFFKGALMSDPHNVLVQQTKNVQAARQMRFTTLKEIRDQAAVIRSAIHEAISVEEAGLKVELKKTGEFEMPVEFAVRLKRSSKLKAAFEALTPGRQRAYLLHFASAKQAVTREARIEKYLDQILAGKGLNDA